MDIDYIIFAGSKDLALDIRSRQCIASNYFSSLFSLFGIIIQTGQIIRVGQDYEEFHHSI